jgi:hypothetical protein
VRLVLWPLMHDGESLQQESTSTGRTHYLTGNTVTACSVQGKELTTTPLYSPEAVQGGAAPDGVAALARSSWL